MTYLALAIALLARPQAGAPQGPVSSDIGRRLVTVGTQYGTPTRALVSGGVLFELGLPDVSTGVVGFLVTGGVGAGAFHIGVGIGGLVDEGPHLSTGIDFSFVATRTNDRPSHATPRATYLGAEAGLVITDVRLSLGFAHRVSGQESGRRNILTWSAGILIPLGHY
jgi:hypothetical protein